MMNHEMKQYDVLNDNIFWYQILIIFLELCVSMDFFFFLFAVEFSGFVLNTNVTSGFRQHILKFWLIEVQKNWTKKKHCEQQKVGFLNYFVLLWWITDSK